MSLLLLLLGSIENLLELTPNSLGGLSSIDTGPDLGQSAETSRVSFLHCEIGMKTSRNRKTHVLLLVVFSDGTSLLVVSIETLVKSLGGIV